MRFAKIIFVLFIFSIAFCGCKKEVLEVHPEMEGKWITYDFSNWSGKKIIINQGKNSTYYVIQRPAEGINVNGIAKIKNRKIKIENEKLIIDALPAYNTSGDYSMIINGEEFFNAMAPRGYMSDITTTQADIEIHFGGWDTDYYFNNNATSFDFDYKTDTSSVWTTIANWDRTPLTGLSPATNYQFKIKAYYPWRDSEYSAITTFTTQ